MRAWSSLQGGEGGETAIAATCSWGNSLISDRRLIENLSSAMLIVFFDENKNTYERSGWTVYSVQSSTVRVI